MYLETSEKILSKIQSITYCLLSGSVTSMKGNVQICIYLGYVCKSYYFRISDHIHF